MTDTKEFLTSATELVEQAQLEKPSESIRFLEYFSAHTKKVDYHRQRLQSYSKALLVLGMGAFAFTAYKTLLSYETSQTYGKGKLGASDSSSDPMQMAFHSMSLMIWGLVASKAKQGLDAASSKDVTTVSSKFSNAISMSVLCILATALQMYGSQQMNVNDIMESASNSSGFKLESAHVVQESHLPSYYDASSSHYMGGAASAAMQSLKTGGAPNKLNIPSVKQLKQAAPIKSTANPLSAGEVMKYFPKSTSKKTTNTLMSTIEVSFDSIRSAFNPFSVSKTQSAVNTNSVTEYFTLVAFIAMAMSYYIMFKSYHTAVAKQAHLSQLLANPKARVAHGEHGAELLEKIKEMDAPKKTVKAASILDEQLEQVESLIKAKKALNAIKPVESQELSSISAYAPPAPAAPTRY